MPGDDVADKPGSEPVDQDSAMDHVRTDDRASLGEFANTVEAELAADYLRANGIATEIGPTIYPGLAGMDLYVRQRDAAEARRLLDEADRSVSTDAADVGEEGSGESE